MMVPTNPGIIRAMAYFGAADNYSVRRAMIFSAFAFWWVPFLLRLRSWGQGRTRSSWNGTPPSPPRDIRSAYVSGFFGGEL